MMALLSVFVLADRRSILVMANSGLCDVTAGKKRRQNQHEASILARSTPPPLSYPLVSRRLSTAQSCAGQDGVQAGV